MKKISTLIMGLLLTCSSLWANSPITVSQDLIGGIESSITRIKGRSNTAPISVAHDFEDATLNAQWQFAQSGKNQWQFGTAAGSTPSGSNALYISDGHGYNYNVSEGSTSWTYIPVSLTAQDEISYYWKGVGEKIYNGTDYDFLKVYLFPQGSTPTAGSSSIPSSAIQLGGVHNNITEWTKATHTPGVEGDYYLCFMWENDYSHGSTNPAAIDNITI